MTNWKNLISGVAVAAISSGIVLQAEAQVTASSMRGTVVDANGAVIANANVKVINERTGAEKTAVTSANGVYFETGLAVGGPYTVSVSNGSDTVEKRSVFLQPGSANLVDLSFEESRVMDAIVITTNVGSGLDLNNGVGSAYSNADILNQPSVTRDLIATLNRDPLANASGEGVLSVAGANPRFNGLAIDGSLQSDDFGLSQSTYATARSPISLDAVESASIVASNYSVDVSGFTGGLVNVTTKSGTNEFEGSAFYYGRDEDFLGNTTEGDNVTIAPFKEDEYGFTLGGPIIKDKLFFFGSYDKFETGAGRSFAGNDEEDGILNTALFSGINDIVQDVYGFDLGGRPDSVSNPESSERIIGKIDWQINDDHRASFTYQSTEETGVGGVGNETFASAYYNTPTEVKAYTGQLFSDWNNELSTEVRVNYKDYQRGQICAAGDTMGSFEIELDSDDLIGSAFEGYLEDGEEVSLVGGCDRYRQGNTFADERLQIFGKANYVFGDHLFSAGAEFQDYKLDNLFAQRSTGQFVYETLDELSTKTADTVTVQNAASGNREDVRAAWGYSQLALFVGDSWQVLPNLNVDYGLRYEYIMQDDEPTARPFFESSYGFSNTSNLDGLDLIMPRVGFEYTPFDRTKVTGGFGLYAGGNPQVWVSNAFTPPLFVESLNNIADADPTQGTPQVLLDALAENDATGPGPIDVISDDFEMPSDWKASARVDQSFDAVIPGIGWDLGSDYQVSLQALYVKTNKGFNWSNLAQTALPTGVAPDGRPIYANLSTLDTNNAIALTNHDEGSSLTLTASISNEFDNGFDFFASYAYQDVEAATPGSSSRGVSNYRSLVDFDRNNPAAKTSPYQIEHAFKVNFGYETEIFDDLTSRFGLFGTFISGDAYSFTFDTDARGGNALFGNPGDGENGYDNDLFYAPSHSGASITDSLVVIGSGFDEAAYIDYAQHHGLPNGGIAPANEFASTWNQKWDFQFTQELPFPTFNQSFLEDSRLKFVLDVENIANLLNDEWGTQYNGPGFDTLSIVKADLVTAADVAANGVDGATALTGDAPRTTCTTAATCVYRLTDFDADNDSFRSDFGSVYKIRMGLRFEF